MRLFISLTTAFFYQGPTTCSSRDKEQGLDSVVFYFISFVGSQTTLEPAYPSNKPRNIKTAPKIISIVDQDKENGIIKC